MSAVVSLLLGGARSGKSAFGENLVKISGLKPVYLATARGLDGEMVERIELHRARREASTGAKWETVEEPLALADALQNCAYSGHMVLVDCLTLWVSNLMEAGANVEREAANLVQSLDGLQAPVVFVANEVGLGIVPDNALAREFRDLAGLVNQKIAARADEVFFIAAGLPLIMKSKD
ncbi:MAG: bifunctional adenosylcobinamide kinase/adenosylcobinamide-phosphate guanylyltransferase [Rhizobiaceae bacterium]|nr:bifunctional adenosylcobinamide kinase/adenosylcobinamide-phosphate guanylyltransferase [Rhizobiaceae bacterium]